MPALRPPGPLGDRVRERTIRGAPEARRKGGSRKHSSVNLPLFPRENAPSTDPPSRRGRLVQWFAPPSAGGGGAWLPQPSTAFQGLTGEALLQLGGVDGDDTCRAHRGGVQGSPLPLLEAGLLLEQLGAGADLEFFVSAHTWALTGERSSGTPEPGAKVAIRRFCARSSLTSEALRPQARMHALSRATDDAGPPNCRATVARQSSGASKRFRRRATEEMSATGVCTAVVRTFAPPWRERTPGAVGGSPSSWRGVAGELSAGWRGVAVELREGCRGVETSPPSPPGPPTSAR